MDMQVLRLWNTLTPDRHGRDRPTRADLPHGDTHGRAVGAAAARCPPHTPLSVDSAKSDCAGSPLVRCGFFFFGFFFAAPLAGRDHIERASSEGGGGRRAAAARTTTPDCLQIWSITSYNMGRSEQGAGVMASSGPRAI